jgi:hypothetical protein
MLSAWHYIIDYIWRVPDATDNSDKPEAKETDDPWLLVQAAPAPVNKACQSVATFTVSDLQTARANLRAGQSRKPTLTDDNQPRQQQRPQVTPTKVLGNLSLYCKPTYEEWLKTALFDIRERAELPFT